MSRIYKNSEAWIFGNQIRQNLKESENRNRDFKDTFDGDRMVCGRMYRKPEDVYIQKYKYNGETGKLNYYTDTSIKSEFEMLNEYNEPYEEGRNTLLWDTCNKYRKNVSSYDVKNDAIRRVYSSKTNKLLIK